MIPEIGDDVVLSFTGKVTSILTTMGNIDLVGIETDQGIVHTFWPAEESSVVLSVLQKGNN